MIKKKNLFKNISLFLCLVPMLLLSFFCLIPQKQDYNVSAADVIVENFNFESGEFIVPTVTYNNSSFVRYCFANLTFGFGYNNGVYSANVTGFVNGSSLNTLSANTTALKSFNLSNVGTTNNVYYMYQVTDSNYHINLSIYRRGTLSHELTRLRVYGNSNDTATNNYVFYDRYDNFICFTIYLTSAVNNFSSASGFVLDDRTYYLNLNDVGLDSLYYEQGYTDGYDNGLIDGEDVGYNNGYDVGVNVGYGNGYNAGVLEGGNYSFLSLIGAVIDAPVSAFTSLLNFELLGINILALITGLLSIALIVLIVKLCMGGK